MNCHENECVCSVKKEDNSGYYRLHTVWKPNSFLINITSKDGAWHGEMSEDDVEKMVDHLSVNHESYICECKEALTTHDGHPGFVYAVENGSFVWKKIIDEDSGIKIKMGMIGLEPANFVNVIQNMFDVALRCNKQLQNNIRKLQENCKKESNDRELLLEQIDSLIKSKEIMEDDLYTRFLLLLNAKKRKIAELESRLEAMQNAKKESSKESDPYEINTDEDNATETDGDTCFENDESSAPSKHLDVNLHQDQNDQGGQTSVTKQRISNDKGDDPPESFNKSDECISEEGRKYRCSLPKTKEELLEYFFG